VDELEQRRLDYLKRNGYLPDHLATLVEDQKCQAANSINNRGLQAQLEYLLKTLTWAEVVETLQVQRKVLQKYHQQFEPKGNREKTR